MTLMEVVGGIGGNAFEALSVSDVERLYDTGVGDKIKAIKLAREITGAGLKEAKDFVEYLLLHHEEVVQYFSKAQKGVFRYDPSKEDYINIIISGAREFTEADDQKLLREDLENCPERLLRYISFRFGKAV